MEIINIYDFLHLLSLSKTKPNMDFGGDLAFAHICHNIKKKILSKRMEKGSQAKTKVSGKKHSMASSSSSFNFFSNYGLINDFLIFFLLLGVFCSPLHMDGHGSINCMGALHI
jgi:hypothetical protein